MLPKYNLGDLLQDKVSQFKGIVMARTEYSTGCIHYGLAAQKTKEDGSSLDWEWFDQSRLVLIKEKAVEFDLGEKPTSGPFPNAPQS